MTSHKGNFWKQLHDLRERVEVLEIDQRYERSLEWYKAVTDGLQTSDTKTEVDKLRNCNKMLLERNCELFDAIRNAPDIPIPGSLLGGFMTNYIRWHKDTRKFIK